MDGQIADVDEVVLYISAFDEGTLRLRYQPVDVWRQPTC
jgi:hypothetical protein